MIQILQDQLIQKECSVVEITTEYLDRIEKLNPTLNAYITVCNANALKRALQLDKELAQFKTTKDRSHFMQQHPLFGIPIAHKDIFSTKGIETTAGSNILRGYIPPYDATVVDRLYKAGVVLLGKLNCDAFAHGASGENSDFGSTKNPYDTARVPGGSSSGSGAAVAADIAVIATGSDTGGSLRNPASFTNTVAIKPTYSRVSRYGIMAMASSTDSIGHIGQTVRDVARTLEITAGFDPHDATSSKVAVGNYLEGINTGIKGLKVGIPKEYLTDGVDSEIRAIVASVAKKYEKLGAKLIEVSLPHTEYALAVYYIVQPSEVSSNLGRFDGIRFGHTRSSFGAEAKRRIMLGTFTLSAGFYDAYYLKAQKVRTLICQDFEHAFKNVDVLLAPVAPMLPPKLGENMSDPLKMYLMDVLTVPANLAGIPGLAIPGGFSRHGLPIGVQLLGKQFDEKTLFRAGFALEQELQLYKQKPNL